MPGIYYYRANMRRLQVIDISPVCSNGSFAERLRLGNFPYPCQFFGVGLGFFFGESFLLGKHPFLGNSVLLGNPVLLGKNRPLICYLFFAIAVNVNYDPRGA